MSLTSYRAAPPRANAVAPSLLPRPHTRSRQEGQDECGVKPLDGSIGKKGINDMCLAGLAATYSSMP
jgi:hypothetical protein